ncbi:MAG TPA: 1-acyl-sn-glycerol-3-phosphate acyltransferase [Devosiaceae bacterium]|nr:1-acyl-sn-glycerol-3-phosphate acyltransferase [Devosiaceae bacterium]
MIAQAIRSLLFYLLFIGQTAILALFIGTVTLFLPKDKPAPAFLWAIGRYWGRSNLVFLRYVVGIRSSVEGTENIPQGGCIIAAKHQSDWDILAIMPHTKLPAFIAKRELLDIPFFGWAARLLNTISVDRKLGGQALPLMLAEAAEKLKHGSEVIIFPEGTRRPPLAPPEYKFGITRLYLALNVPVVPVAVNSGLFWGRNSPVLWPGTARARFLPAIPPGLAQQEFQARLVDTIEAASRDLALGAFREGLARPIPPELRQRFEAAQASVEP